ncbi:hypothetical protein [Streptomyces sp. NPDC046887]|uniref:hypothetical protein n=1 Tax=Streptomyces sp. NPDC046887 TaxID=3155472 RepID=UPI0033D25BA7
MHKRLSLHVTCLALAAAFGVSACGPSDDRGASAPVASAAGAPSASASAAPSITASGTPSAPSPSATPAEEHRLTGTSAKFYLYSVRKQSPGLDRISDKVLVAHGDAFCTVSGKDAFVEQTKKTEQELALTKDELTQVLAAAQTACGRERLF